MGTVAAGVLLFGYGRPAQAAPDACITSGSVTTCTGNQSDGITNGPGGDFTTPPTTTLRVNRLTQDIAPASGTSGIEFADFARDIAIVADTTDGPGGPVAIVTRGANSFGVAAIAGSRSASITHTGDVTTFGTRSFGLYAYTLTGPQASITHRGAITTLGDSSDGIVALGPDSMVSIRSTGDIATSGDDAYGITAMGHTGASVVSNGNISTRGDTSYGIYAYSYFRPVSVRQTGNISTRGEEATGVIANSYYGYTSVAVTGNITTKGAYAYGIVAGGYYGVGVVMNGNISTRGDGAYGIYAFAKGGPIAILQNGDITTRGQFADGIHADTDGSIVILVNGDVTVSGAGADAIDVGHGYGVGDSLVIVGPGSTVTGGAGSGDGIDFDGGRLNYVANFGTITTLGENAIEGEGTGAEIVYNFGVITGNVDLGPGANRFENFSGGVFNSGANVFIGSGNLLRNAGTLSPGGSGSIRTTALTGNLVQTGSGVLATDLSLGNRTTDVINVSGTAALDGTVKVSVQNPALVDQRFTILSADGGVTDNGLGLLASPALQAQLLFPNPNDVVLDVDVNFALGGMNRNQTAIGSNLNQVLGAGGGSLDPVFLGLLNVYSFEAYTDALDQLSPEIYADIELLALYSASDFSDNLLSCHVNGTDTASINREGECLWVGAKGRDFQAQNDFENIGFDETAGQFAAGGQVALNPVWRLGGGLGFQSSSLSTNSGARSDGEQLQGGLALKYNPGSLLLAGAVSGAHGWYDTTRSMNFGGFSEMAQASHDLDVLQGRLHGSYVLGNPGLYTKPMIDAAITNVDLGNVNEFGAGGAGLALRGVDHTVFSISPAVEFGTEWWWSNGTLVRPYVRAGVTWYSEDDVTVAASFSGAPSSVSPFSIVAESDDVQADIAAGVELITAGNSSVRVFYDGQFGERIAVQAAGFKAGVKF
ncbi:Autotransporter beta-domain protein [Methyloligella halotolerans]|uniref:Autotransporter beta-domain protein n=1 Tax=Methyloligella halotolerans TaxID=1177755 RepID=A0A1E2RVT6_9HYPH|nr:autotransporter outer membrane beta-barrel domain-containing protein [Methyloligella halotolerans]ODA66240.1 Autotransporter beta-domain protein [Methyloligella halotolerans]